MTFKTQLLCAKRTGACLHVCVGLHLKSTTLLLYYGYKEIITSQTRGLSSTLHLQVLDALFQLQSKGEVKVDVSKAAYAHSIITPARAANMEHIKVAHVAAARQAAINTCVAKFDKLFEILMCKDEGRDIFGWVMFGWVVVKCCRVGVSV